MILIYKIGNLLSFIMAAVFCAQLWSYRRSALTRLYLINLSLVMYWSFAVLLTLFTDDFFLKIQFTKMRQAGIPFLIVNWLLVFVFIFHRSQWSKIKKYFAILYILPILTSFSTILSLFGNKFFEGLISYSFAEVPNSGGLLAYKIGPLLSVQFSYAGLLMLLLLLLFIINFFSKKADQRNLGLLFFSSALLQIALEFFARTKYGGPVLIQCNTLSYIPMMMTLYYAIHKTEFLNIKTFSNQVAFDQLPLPVITINPRGELWDANKSSFQVFSLSHNDIGISVLQDSRFHFIRSREKTICYNGKEYQVDYHDLTLNSKSVLIVSLTDITPLAELNNELSENNTILKLMNSEILKITSFNKKIHAVLSHDLSGLLNYMVISLTHLFKNNQIEENDKNLAESILKTNRSSLELLNSILAWSHEEVVTEVSLHALLQEIESSQSMLLKEHQVELDITVELHRTFNTSARAMQAILRNLISNAIKNSPPKSTVSVVVNDHQNELEIFIIDQGAGIDQAILQNAREARTSQKSSYGFGIGLQLTFDFVRQLNGSIHFESSPHMGTIVRLHFFA